MKPKYVYTITLSYYYDGKYNEHTMNILSSSMTRANKLALSRMNSNGRYKVKIISSRINKSETERAELNVYSGWPNFGYYMSSLNI